MPRKSFKKKKGKVIRPGMGDAVGEKVKDMLNSKLAGLGLDLNLPNAAAANPTGAKEEEKAPSASDSINESQYTFYSESVLNQSAMNEVEFGKQPDVKVIQNDIEMEEQKDRGNQLLSSRDNTKDSEKLSIDETDKSKGRNSTGKKGSEQVFKKDDEQVFNSKHSKVKSESSPFQKSQKIDTPRSPPVLVKEEEEAPVEVLEEVKAPEPVDEEISGDFLDDFDAAFGDHNDVPILDLKKNKEQAAKADEPVQAPIVEARLDTPAPAKKVIVDEPVAVEDDGFFDDFDTAFGDHNDVPILIMKKEEKKKPQEPEKVQEEVKAPEPVEEEISGDFLDDFDAAFGDHNDVPILDLKKNAAEKKNKDEKTQQKEKVEQKPAEEETQPPVTIAKAEPQVETAETQDQPTQEAAKDVQAGQISPSLIWPADQATEKTASAPVVQVFGPRLTDVAEEQPIQKPTQAQQQQVQFENQPIETPRDEGATFATTQTTQDSQPSARKTQTASTLEDKEQAAHVNYDGQNFAAVQTCLKRDQSLKQDDVKQDQIEMTSKDDQKEVVAVPEAQAEESKIEQEDEADTQSGSGTGRKILMLGAACALAAGAFFFVKKNNIQVDQILKSIQDKLKQK